MAGSRRKNRGRGENRLATLGIAIVVGFLAVAILFRGGDLRKQNREYQVMEESLDAEIAEEKQTAQELEERKVYVKTKEYVIEKAREIFQLKMPDEIIVQPES